MNLDKYYLTDGKLMTVKHNYINLWNTIDEAFLDENDYVYFNSERYNYRLGVNMYYLMKMPDYKDSCNIDDVITCNIHNEDKVEQEFIKAYWDRNTKVILDTILNNDDFLNASAIMDIIFSYMDKLNEEIIYSLYR